MARRDRWRETGIALTLSDSCCTALPMQVNEVIPVGVNRRRMLTVTRATLWTSGGVSPREKFLWVKIPVMMVKQ
jgi:hypothetical protein